MKNISIIKLFIVFLVSIISACVQENSVDNVKASDAQMQLGIGYLKLNELALAKEPLKRAIELNKKNADAYMVLALVFQREDEIKLAEKNFLKALKIEPKNSRILSNYAVFLRESKRYEESMQRFTQASEDPLYTERASVFENMGITALMMNQHDEAKKYFQRAIRLDWRRGRSLIELTELNYADKNYDEAYRYYSGFVGLVGEGIHEQDAHTLSIGVKVAKAKNKKIEAANYGLQLRDLYPNSPEYRMYQEEE